jgi:hypothetical protein
MKRFSKQIFIGSIVLCFAASCTWPPSMIQDSAKQPVKYTSAKKAAPTAKLTGKAGQTK